MSSGPNDTQGDTVVPPEATASGASSTVPPEAPATGASSTVPPVNASTANASTTVPPVAAATNVSPIVQVFATIWSFFTSFFSFMFYDLPEADEVNTETDPVKAKVAQSGIDARKRNKEIVRKITKQNNSITLIFVLLVVSVVVQIYCGRYCLLQSVEKEYLVLCYILLLAGTAALHKIFTMIFKVNDITNHILFYISYCNVWLYLFAFYSTWSFVWGITSTINTMVPPFNKNKFLREYKRELKSHDETLVEQLKEIMVKHER